MKMFQTLARRLGYVKAATAERAFAAAAVNRLTFDWLTSTLSASDEIQSGLKRTRERSQEQERNNDYAKRFFNLIVKNVIGHQGIRLQVRAKDAGGGMDNFANETIETAWKDWGKKDTCSVDGKKSWLDSQKLFVRGSGRDGESIIRMIKGFPNKYNFALQFFAPELLDHELNGLSPSGNRIKQGIETNAWGRPIAFWFLGRALGSSDYAPNVFDVRGSTTQGPNGRSYNVVPADQIIHGYLEDRDGQMRGIPWMHTGMTRLKQLSGYEEAELVAARSAACKMGFYKPNDLYQPDDKDSKGAPIQEMEPGIMEQLPYGLDFQTHDPTHPTTAFGEFVKATLRGVAAGLDISYNKLANDLEGVTFSSLREGSIDERDGYRLLQAWTVEHLCQVVFENWLEMYLLTGLTTLPFAKFDKFHADQWQPRAWKWVDPLKEAKAKEIGVARNWTSDKQVAADQGNDIEDNIRENKLTEAEVGPTANGGGNNGSQG